MPVTRGVACDKGLNLHSGLSFKAWPTIGDLTGNIHPIFDLSNFDGGLDYALMRQALLLATKLITAKELLPFWWTVLFSATKPVRDVLYHQNGDAGSLEFTETPDVLSDNEARETAASLADIAGNVFFRAVDGQLFANDIWGMSTADDPSGKRATVTFGKAAMTELQRCAELLKKQDIEPPYLGAAFTFAVSLVHELAHSVFFIARGPDTYFFPGAPVSEDGFAWEGFVFGGILRVSQGEDNSGAQTTVHYRNWPCPHIVADYVEHKRHMGIRLTHAENLLPAAPWGHPWSDNAARAYVNFSYIRGLFSEKFWDEDVVLRGPFALRTRIREWIKAPLTSSEIECLARMYRLGKRPVEDRALAANRDELRKFTILCAKWEAFMADWIPDSL